MTIREELIISERRMTEELSWGASFGSQLLAEISLLDANLNRSVANSVSLKPMEKSLAFHAEKENLCEASFPSSETKYDSQFFTEVNHLEALAIKGNPKDEYNHITTHIVDNCVKTHTQLNSKLGGESSVVPESTLHVSSVEQCKTPSLSHKKLKVERKIGVRRSARNKQSQKTPSPKPDCNISSVENTPLGNIIFSTSASEKKNLYSNVSVSPTVPATKLLLSHWGLPISVIKRYEEKKITQLFPWQVKCLETGNVLKGGNLIYSAPTSSGKTLVAELLMLKSILENKRKAIYILPFVAVAKEKTRVLKEITEEVGIRVDSFAGSSSPPGGFKVCDLAICTIEKANSLINKLIEERNIEDLGILVVDELHLIGDSHRGYLIELLLTKILYATSRTSLRIQIVGMSATLPNLNLLAQWLKADLFVTDFRPIPLKEHVKIGTEIFFPDFQLVREIDSENLIPNDIEHIIYLSLETILEGHSVLIFCPTKNWCEKMAQHVSNEFFNIGSNPSSHNGILLRQQLKGELLVQVLERLKATPAGLDSVLAQTIRFAVAFHHAGLTCEEREVVESSFRLGILRVLIATSTLSSGVNLPARRVIIRTPIFHGSIIDYQVYKQMIGRAGRYGVDTDGESYLVCQPHEKHQVARMLSSTAPPLRSCLMVANVPSSEPLITVSMKRAILEVIATGSASTTEDIEMYASCTLLSILNNVSQETIDACVTWLVSNEFIRRQNLESGSERLIPSQLGLGCLASSLSPDESLVLLNELKTARRGLILDNDLHLIYQITPTYVANQLNHLDWLHFLTLWEELSECQKRVGEAVGVEDRFLIRAMKGTIAPTAPRQLRQLAIHRRFYTALALHELMNEVSLAEVANKYKLNKGTLQSLQQQTATFAGMVTIFCHRLGWNTLYVLMEHFQSRLLFGVQLELCNLMRLPSMTSQIARLLYNAGITNVAGIASTSHENIDALLKNASPFKTAEEIKSKRLSVDDLNYRLLVEEARSYVQLELGVEINWNRKSTYSGQSQKQTIKCKSQNTPESSPAPKKGFLIKLTPKISDIPSPAFHSSPVLAKQEKTPHSASQRVNRRVVNVTPDMFAENSLETSVQLSSLLPSPECHKISTRLAQTPLSKAVESMRLDESGCCETLITPKFAACAEILEPVTANLPAKLIKRRFSASASTFLETTPRCYSNITAIVSKKVKLKNEKNGLQASDIVYDPSLLSNSSSSLDESSMIPSSLPASNLTVHEVKTNSKMAMLISKLQKQSVIAFNIYKERNSIMGIAISWTPEEVHYLLLRETFDTSLDQSKVSKLKPWFQALGKSGTEVVIFDIRQVTKDLKELCQIPIHGIPFRDVDLCHWLLEPTNGSITIGKLSKFHGSQVSPSKTLRGRQKSLHECSSLLQIYSTLKQRLVKEQLFQSFVEIEMPVAIKMLQMENYGIGFNRARCEEIMSILRQHLKNIEEDAHRTAARVFSLTSAKDCSKIVAHLNIEEKAPISFINPLKRKKVLPSVKKATLVKLGKIHQLPRMIIEYRKIHAIIQTIVCPLLQATSFFVDEKERIAGECEFRTVTGRINIVRPNLQHIPRPFMLSDSTEINLRNCFQATSETCLISADYSQLELRILAHLSSDPALCSILNRMHGDVFRIIASTWKRKGIEEVTSDERQQAKQICYGVIYGMGNKSLADHLEIDEEEALIFAESFHKSYPHIQKFIDNTISYCRSNGFVVTIHGRKRYLPAILSNNAAQRAQAERQAVNTRIQGSASDLVKSALVLIDRAIKEVLTGVHLVHQIHDELLFQVPVRLKLEAVNLIRHCMETAIPMKIKLPVSIKSGSTWGTLEPFPS